METWVQQIAVPLAVAVLTSSGLWALVSKLADKNDAERKMLVGLAHTKNPAKAKPFVAPYGTSGVYMKDECVLWTDGKVYVSVADNNVYTPEEYTAWWTRFDG